MAGASGVGKSTLAARIGACLALPYIELDGLHWGNGWTPRPTFVEDVERLTFEPRWVTEFQYHQVRPLLAARAQLIVFLDYRRPVTLYRITARTLRRSRARERLWGTDNVEPPLHTLLTDPDHIVRWSMKGVGKSRRTIAEVAATHPDLPIVRLRSPRSTRGWLTTLQPEAPGPDVRQESREP